MQIVVNSVVTVLCSVDAICVKYKGCVINNTDWEKRKENSYLKEVGYINLIFCEYMQNKIQLKRVIILCAYTKA